MAGVEEQTAQPVLRWAGSKKRQLAKLLPLFPTKISSYVEPFAGSACVFFKLRPQHAVIADINLDLIDFYQTASHHASRVYREFEALDRNAATYYAIRKTHPTERGAIKKAAHFLYLNRNCFNGIYRVNRDGIFNVPFSDARVAPYPSQEQFKAAMTALRDQTICIGDFEEICTEHSKTGTFVYLDPPYYTPNSRSFIEYTKRDFGLADFDRLAALLRILDKRGCLFMLSYPKCRISTDIGRKWITSEVMISRSVAGKAQHRRSATELVIRNYRDAR